ncbi:hypothetical protein [Roseateles cavernae]|uniref:hypothetical protein n=1 Tax=Roseateles cavernae TaxID=3153578 RepID=UPI0032E39232
MAAIYRAQEVGGGAVYSAQEGAGGTTATITGAGGIPSAEAVGTPALTATGGGSAGVITGAGGIASAEAVGTPTLSASLWPVVSPPGIPSAEALGTPTLIVVAAEFDEPVTVAEAKLAARMDADITVLDEEVAVAISAARQQAELITGRRYRPTVVVYELAAWPLPTEPLSVHAARACAVDYWDGAAWQTLPPSEYVFAPGGIGGNATCLAPQIGRSWPALGDVSIGPRVRVSLTAGPVTRQAVPAAVKLFIKAHVSAWMNSDSLVPQNMVLNPVLVRILDAERLWG